MLLVPLIVYCDKLASVLNMTRRSQSIGGKLALFPPYFFLPSYIPPHERERVAPALGKATGRGLPGVVVGCLLS